MATVRIYKVAELLGVASQEVLALLKSDHGIELKSASSTLEEVVARSFVERVARQRNIDLPGGDMFSDKAAAKAKGGKKAALAKKAEPPKPTAPVLGPPRLVKTIRPPTPPPAEETADAAVDASAPAETPDARTETAGPVTSAAAVDGEPSESSPVEDDARVEEPTADTPTAPGRFVPPTLRLRIEEPGQTLQPPRPLVPARRPQTSQARMVKKPAATPPAGARPPVPGGARPGAPGAPRPGYPGPLRPTTPSMLGGPRPLPSQPVRPQQARPGMLPPRPPFGHRPPFGQHRPGQRPVQGRRRARPTAPVMPSAPAAPPPITRSITLAEGMTVKDLADKLEVRVKDVLAKLLMKRVMLTINSTLDIDTARDIAGDFGAEIEMRSFEEELVSAEIEHAKPEDVQPRAPVVTVMGPR